MGRSLRRCLSTVVPFVVITLGLGFKSNEEPAKSLLEALNPPVRLAALVTESRSEALPPISRFICSGYLYGNVFATAEHCLRDSDSSKPIVIAFGSDDLCRSDSWEYARGVVDRVSPTADVGVARVGGIVDASHRVADWAAAGSPHLAGREYVVVGWQASVRPGVVGCRPTATVIDACTATRSQAECEVDLGQSVCVGMSGAPVLSSHGELVGLLSSSTSCSGGRVWFGLGRPVMRGVPPQGGIPS